MMNDSMPIMDSARSLISDLSDFLYRKLNVNRPNKTMHKINGIRKMMHNKNVRAGDDTERIVIFILGERMIESSMITFGAS